MISYAAFYDELEKIAAADYVTKEKLKRHLKAVGAVGIGSGLGAGTGLALRRYLERPEMLAKIKKLPPGVLKAIPAIAAGLGGAAGLAKIMRTRKHLEYVRKGK